MTKDNDNGCMKICDLRNFRRKRFISYHCDTVCPCKWVRTIRFTLHRTRWLELDRF